MNAQTHYDILVIGAGPAGYCAAIRAAQLGFSTAVIDKSKTAGGTCINVGCIPSKALLDSSELFDVAKNVLSAHGVNAGNVSLDLGAMMARKNGVVAALTGGIETLFRANRINFVHGAARFTGPRELAIESAGGTYAITAGRAIVIAAGSAPAGLASVPIDGTTVVDSTAALSFDKVPARLAIVGGGAIGVELGSVWSRLGAKVTIIELMPQLLPGWDGQAARLLARVLNKQGVAVMTGANVEGEEMRGDGMHLAVRWNNMVGDVAADKVLVAVGRRPYTENLGLDKIGIIPDQKTGCIPISKLGMTACDGVYAAGDCVPGPMLAHKAFEEGIAVVETIAGKAGHVDYATIPGVVYTSPEIAFVGATEENLKERGIAFAAGSFPFRANGRASAMGATDGFVKVLSDAATDAVLGVHIVGPVASELVAEAVSVMAFGGSAEDIARTVHAHPTLSEALREAALDVDKRSLHAPPVGKKQ
ncbi:MAG TPA: dihydrolipoyl dehydrogenase [Chitinivibrionales bacterium]|nr:dihydrolipoyl dehydrogenase [Chitinivibrionales bacterium]